MFIIRLVCNSIVFDGLCRWVEKEICCCFVVWVDLFVCFFVVFAVAFVVCWNPILLNLFFNV